jgi:hypothetical protein
MSMSMRGQGGLFRGGDAVALGLLFGFLRLAAGGPAGEAAVAEPDLLAFGGDAALRPGLRRVFRYSGIQVFRTRTPVPS